MSLRSGVAVEVLPKWPRTRRPRARVDGEAAPPAHTMQRLARRVATAPSVTGARTLATTTREILYKDAAHPYQERERVEATGFDKLKQSEFTERRGGAPGLDVVAHDARASSACFGVGAVH